MADTGQPVISITALDGRDQRMAELEEQAEQVKAENMALPARSVPLEQPMAELQRETGGATPSLVTAPALDTS